MPRVACLMMQKDEAQLLEPWIKYHAHLFGLENLFVWDNGSSSEETRRILSHYQARGLNVDISCPSGLDFRRKGVILGDKIKELEATGRYDFFFPVDCDEFLVLRSSDTSITTSRGEILDALANLREERQALGISRAFNNVFGHPGYYWPVPHKKTFFRSGTFKVMDHGYHEGQSRLAEGVKLTEFAYMHYHHKPHAVIVEHSKNKLRPYMDIDNPDELRAVYPTNRLAKFILDDEAQYMAKFTTEKAVHIPSFEESLRRNGIVAPFAPLTTTGDTMASDEVASLKQALEDILKEAEAAPDCEVHPHLADIRQRAAIALDGNYPTKPHQPKA